MEAKDFILTGLLVDPNLRPSSEQMLMHPWLLDADKPSSPLAIPQDMSQITFMLRAGHQIDNRSFENFLEALQSMATTNDSIKNLIAIRHRIGLNGLQLVIHHFLKELPPAEFETLISLLSKEGGFDVIEDDDNFSVEQSFY